MISGTNIQYNESGHLFVSLILEVKHSVFYWKSQLRRKVDKKFRVPKEEKGVQTLEEEKKTNIFFLYFFVLVSITMYLAQGYVSP